MSGYSIGSLPSRKENYASKKRHPNITERDLGLEGDHSDPKRPKKTDHAQLGKNAHVRNKNAAEQQITAEQLIREATERSTKLETEPRQDIVGEDELVSYQARKRKEFEDRTRMNRHDMSAWVAYAKFEASMKEFTRTRSVWERALQVDMNQASIWLKYVEFEQKEGFINHARNLFDRVTLHLPRVDQFWYKYAYMEELLGNFSGARAIFERWMEFEPEDNGWTSFVKFEERCGEIDRARRIMERYVSCHPTQAAFIRLCKFEERHKDFDRTRSGYTKAIEILEEDLDEKFWIAFAQFEIRRAEVERARAIFKLALERIPKQQAEDLYQKYVNFEKMYGKQKEIEDVVTQKRRFAYEEQLKETPYSYDTWFDYLRLEESAGNDPEQLARTRELYERGISKFPLSPLKEHWRRYIYLWYNYALWEETACQDFARARQIYDTILKVTASKKLFFAKLYKLYSEFEIRQLNLEQARRIFGRGMGECGKVKIFQWYADTELRFGNFDKCRKIYEKLCETHALEPHPWISYVEFEESLEEFDRAREILETAIGFVQDMPELIWKKYISLEAALGEMDSARRIFGRLLEKSTHVRVWKAFAEFELYEARDLEKMREVFERGLKVFKTERKGEQRAMLLETWLGLEREVLSTTQKRVAGMGGEEEEMAKAEAAVKKILDRQAKKKKVRRKIEKPGFDEEDYEEGIDYVFPDDDAAEQNFRILAAAAAWKKKKAAAAAKAAGTVA